MKPSDKLYLINANLSAQTYIIKKEMSIDQMQDLNRSLGEIIKEIRELEEK